MATKRGKHSEEFKPDAVRMRRNRGDRTVAPVADDLGVRPNVRYRWSAKLDNEAVAKRTTKARRSRTRTAGCAKRWSGCGWRGPSQKGRGLLRTGQRVDSSRFILAEKADSEVRVMCEVLGVSPSAYYEWEREQQSQHARRDSELPELIQALFAQFRGRDGAPRIHGELAKAGVNVSRKRVGRLMRKAGIRAKEPGSTRRRRTRGTPCPSHPTCSSSNSPFRRMSYPRRRMLPHATQMPPRRG